VYITVSSPCLSDITICMPDELMEPVILVAFFFCGLLLGP